MAKEMKRGVMRVHNDPSEPACLPQSHIQFSLGTGVDPKGYSYNDTVAAIDRLGDQYQRTVNEAMND